MKTIAHKINAIIFDMDGTIIKTERLWESAKADVVISLGVNPFTQEHRNFLRSLIGLNMREHSIRIKEAFNLANDPEEIGNLINEAANKRFHHNIDFVDGFETFHQKLQAFNIPSAIGTNTNIINLTTLTKTLSLNRFFGSHIYSQEHAGFRPKPDPAVFLHAAQQLGAKPEHCIVFEDSLFGFQAAKAAGMRCVAIKTADNLNTFTLANTAISTYHEAEEALKSLYIEQPTF
jgi:beta-phosphoglucomutase-like phosphatase (HAD superfamily)